jgi:hypothetical protein
MAMKFERLPNLFASRHRNSSTKTVLSNCRKIHLIVSLSLQLLTLRFILIAFLTARERMSKMQLQKKFIRASPEAGR